MRRRFSADAGNASTGSGAFVDPAAASPPAAPEAANLGAIEFLRELAAEYAGEIPETRLVGYVGPRGDAYTGRGTMSVAEAEDYHSVQIATLAEARVDLVQAMTFDSASEATGVVRAAHAAELAVSVSFSLDSSHRLNTGLPLREAVLAVDHATDGYASYFALNCSHPNEFEPALDGGEWTRRLRSIRPNAACMDEIAPCKLGHLEEGDPSALAVQMADAVRRYPQVDIVGGCCGTDHVHLDKMVRRLLAA